ncbi:carboxypeptidase regulatory-like domain-containing protein [Nocardioides mesophilus]|uniref:Carboxypeptidase regulatory-like domain-containing protein n=1 Tax=Nocardioides mesophilus TaxID=433659 RepID=A0A7G9RFQ0_9ACTN|nr:carboxypeptidase regulatory-like domain-containing protein [Nocardioides mesophilus]QNN54425.1 carboxypeptidase regulatory-like domain-containing protein [Nocardioides mesophilus]
MTEEPQVPGAGRPLDGADTALLQEVAAMYDAVDPVPDDLVARVRFALALDEVFEEVAEMTRLPAESGSVRSDTASTGSTVRTDTLTFSADRLTAMVTVSRAGAARVRIDGWVSPLGARRIHLRMQGAHREVRTDAGGRFVVDDLREGFVQLVLHALDTEDTDELVVTPLFKL